MFSIRTRNLDEKLLCFCRKNIYKRSNLLIITLIFLSLFFFVGETHADTAGGYHTCVVKSDGTVYCWGTNWDGNLGNGSTDSSPLPVQVRGVGGSGYLTGITQVSEGVSNTCAVKSDGTVYCWGANWSGQLGNNSTGRSSLPVQVLDTDGYGNLAGVVQVAVGAESSCAAKTDGTVFCWGFNGDGELGNNSTSGSRIPVQVAGVSGSGNLTNISQIAAGDYNTCALKSDGTVFCWGNGENGELGNNNSRSSFVPVQVVGMGGISQISVGSYHSCALRSDGSAFCWGANWYGELGNNSNDSSNAPVQVQGVDGSGYLADVSQLSSGKNHSCAVKSDGAVFCWGNNGDGEMGDNTYDQRLTPVQVLDADGSSNLGGVGKILSGYYHNCAIKLDGSVFCWGQDSYNQLGNNDTSNSPIPVQVVGPVLNNYLSNINQINARWGSACSAKSDGSAFCWGQNDHGQLGNNSTASSFFQSKCKAKEAVAIFLM